MTPFQSLREYGTFVYTLRDQFPCIVSSTLVLYQRGRMFAELTGEVSFPEGYRLNVFERLTWDSGSLAIEGYSYEVWRGGEELYWCDSQPHPNDPTLADTDPHHKHVPPDAKHNRIPAPGLSLTEPNLPFLIREVEVLLGR
ncbi:MAG: hypothetical protein HY321_03265 [Armatimonadetes bacterium]|nr:hypothetical protein [Armatimonadota bacterium]